MSVARDARGTDIPRDTGARDIPAEDLRLTALALLAQARGYRANEYLLRTLLREWGHVASRDGLRGELAWLAERGLISIEEIGGVMIAALTECGHDAQAGAAEIPGVRRPGPGAA